MPRGNQDQYYLGKICNRQAKDDTLGMYGDDDDGLLDDVDITKFNIDDFDPSIFETHDNSIEDQMQLEYESDDDSSQNLVKGLKYDCMLGGQSCTTDVTLVSPLLETASVSAAPFTAPAPLEPFPPSAHFAFASVATAPAPAVVVVPNHPVPAPAPPSVVVVPNHPVPATVQLPKPVPSVVITHSTNKVVTIHQCNPPPQPTPLRGFPHLSEKTVVVTNNVMVKEPARSVLLNNKTAVSPLKHLSPAFTPVGVDSRREFPTPQNSRPDSPLSLSDDDYTPIPIFTPADNSASIFRSALDVLTTPSTVWEDFDLWFGSDERTKDETPSGLSQEDIISASAKSDHDHNYVGSNRGQTKNYSLQGLGVDTPSQSESSDEDEEEEEEEEEEDEEIDVESLSRSNSSRSSSSCSDSDTSQRPTSPDIETLLSASQAVSKKLRQTQNKRKRGEHPGPEPEYLAGVQTAAKWQKGQRRGGGRGRKRQSKFGDEDSREKREMHNNMERRRRIDLRHLFDDLKSLVPVIADREKAPKVVILREASNLCYELGAECQSKSVQVMALRKEQERLRRMVSSLRKAACVSRRRH